MVAAHRSTMFMTVAILSILSGLSSGLALATKRQVGSRSQFQDLCDRRYSSSTTVVGKKLYINGGQNLSNRTASTLDYSNFNDLQHIDLSSTWTISSPLLTTESKPNTLTTVNEACAWSDGIDFYQYGGWQVTNPEQEEFKVWDYEISSSTWTAVSAGSVNRLASGGYTNAPKIRKSYAFGGFQDNATTSDPWYSQQGMLDSADARADMIEFDWESKTAKNVTYTNKSNRNPAILDNSLAYVPVGESGILVSISGRVSLRPSGYTQMSSFGEIQFFDIASSTWYHQIAVGALTQNDMPYPRVEACTVVQPAADNSSFNIYMFGGSTLNQEDAAFNDLWVLSLPSFKWFKVENVAEGGGEIAGERTSHTCQIIGNRQMAIIGGGRSAGAHEQCQKISVFVFDMSALSWRAGFDPSEPTYVLPKAITDVIGGNESGNADPQKNKPDFWTDPAIEAIFFGGGTSVRSNSTSAPSVAQSSEGHKKPSIVGGVVGGLVTIAALGVIGMLFMHRRRRNEFGAAQTEYAEVHELPPERALHELPPERALHELQSSVPTQAYSSKSIVHELQGEGKAEIKVKHGPGAYSESVGVGRLDGDLPPQPEEEEPAEPAQMPPNRAPPIPPSIPRKPVPK